jgi:hypothetical protein
MNLTYTVAIMLVYDREIAVHLTGSPGCAEFFMRVVTDAFFLNGCWWVLS